MTEAAIESRMVRMVRERGGLCYKFVSPSNPGVPDRIVITPAGAIHFVELKTEVGRLANIQAWQISEFGRCSVQVKVLKGWPAVRAFIDEVLPK